MNTNKTLSSKYYLDSNYYDKELKNILYRSWNYIGHTSQIKNSGDYLTATIGEENLVIIRTNSGELKGFYNGIKSYRNTG